jgi:plastocyanin
MKNFRKIHVAAFAAAAVAAMLAIPALAASPQATLTIRHQMHGCHAWSLNGGAYKASQSVALARGGTLKVIDNDVMAHRLVQLSGTKVTIRSAAMKKMSASATVNFAKAGVYKFTTKPGEDYKWAAKMKTMGEDNVLRLVVRVS